MVLITSCGCGTRACKPRATCAARRAIRHPAWLVTAQPILWLACASMCESALTRAWVLSHNRVALRTLGQVRAWPVCWQRWWWVTRLRSSAVIGRRFGLPAWRTWSVFPACISPCLPGRPWRWWAGCGGARRACVCGFLLPERAYWGGWRWPARMRRFPVGAFRRSAPVPCWWCSVRCVGWACVGPGLWCGPWPLRWWWL